MLGARPAHREQRTEVDIGAGGLGESEPEIGAGSQGEQGIIAAGARACAVVIVVLAGFTAMPAATARPSDPGVVNHAVLDKGSVGNIVGATMGWEDMSTVPVQDYWIDLPVCNNYADIGLPEVYNDPGLASFNSAVMQESPTDETHYVKQAVGVFATNNAANGAFTGSWTVQVGARGRPPRCTLTTGRPRSGRSPTVRSRAPTPRGASRRPAPTVAASSKPGCGKTFCCRRRCVSRATAVPQ